MRGRGSPRITSNENDHNEVHATWMTSFQASSTLAWQAQRSRQTTSGTSSQLGKEYGHNISYKTTYRAQYRSYPIWRNRFKTLDGHFRSSRSRFREIHRQTVCEIGKRNRIHLYSRTRNTRGSVSIEEPKSSTSRSSAASPRSVFWTISTLASNASSCHHASYRQVNESVSYLPRKPRRLFASPDAPRPADSA